MVSPDEHHQQAIVQVRGWVEAKFKGSTALSEDDLSQSPVANAVVGWRLPRDGGGGLQLILDREYPYSEPRFVVEGGSEVLGGPHIEKRGKVCVAGDSARIDSTRPVDVVEFSYNEAVSLLNSNRSQENDLDFTEHFGAYWLREAESEKFLLTLVQPKGPSRLISSWKGKRLVVADDLAMLERFVRNMKLASEPTVGRGFAIWMDSLPHPNEYPASVDGLRRLVKNRSNDGLAILDKVLTAPQLPVFGVFMGSTGKWSEPGIAGIRIDERVTVHQPGRKVQDALNKGFRPGKVPPAILAQRLDLLRMPVEAIDGAKSRRPPYISAELASKTICLVGCGSLGSGIAKLLLQSGVGKVILIDPDSLSWVNLERHELGATWVGHNKAAALATDLQTKFPLAEIEGHPQSWLEAYRADPALLSEANLVLSTCAEWNAESALSDLQSSGALQSPVLYGWLEESALAAHAIALSGQTPCLRCGFTPTGNYLFPVVRVAGGAPAGCGGGLSLYGAVDMAPGQAMIAGVALDLLLGRAKAPVHRVWLCSKPTLDGAEADWSPEWLVEHGVPPAGGTITPSGWPLKKGCPCHS